MKRIFSLSSYFLFLSVLFFVSCTKEDVKTDRPATIDKIQDIDDAQASPEADFCFTNPDNPYDYVGVQHNAALDAVAAIPNFEDLSRKEVYDAIGQYVREASGTDIEMPYDVALEAFSMIEGDSPVEKIAEIGVEVGEISAEAAELMVQMKNLVFDSPDPIAFGHNMIEFEAGVMANNNLTDKDRTVLLGGAAVARYSACYWGNAAINPYNPWHNRLISRIGYGNGIYWWWPRICCLIIWDFCGYWWGCIWYCWWGWPWCPFWGGWCGIWWGSWWSWGCWWYWWCWWC